MNKPKNNTGIRRLLNATRFSIQGFKSTFKTEAAFRQECYLGLIALPVSFFIASSTIEWVLLITSFLFLMLVEVINSAIEATVDRFGDEYHNLSGKAKDAGSAAVAIAIFIVFITWSSIAIMK